MGHTTVLPEGSWIAIFHALHRVMAAEAALIDARIPHRVLSTPRPLTSSCGLAIVLPAELLDEAEGALATRDLSIRELYQRESSGYRRISRTKP